MTGNGTKSVSIILGGHFAWTACAGRPFHNGAVLEAGNHVLHRALGLGHVLVGSDLGDGVLLLPPQLEDPGTDPFGVVLLLQGS